jgi:uncharacterized protein (DUF2336 family)
MADSSSLIDELENAIKNGSKEKRIDTLRQVTDLFLHGANELNDEQIGVFDDVLCTIADRIEKTALAELGSRLAPIDNAPIEIVRRLAKDEDIAVAAPVLTGSKRLTTTDLVAIARSRGDAYLLAISEREALEPALTDVLLDRGNQKVVAKLAGNAGARFSSAGYEKLVDKASGNDDLAQVVGLRRDLPANVLKALLQRATEAVRARILALVPEERRHELQGLIEKISKALAASSEPDYSMAEAYVRSLEVNGRIHENTLLKLIQKHQYDEMVVAVARLCSAANKTVAELFLGPRNDAVLIPCRAADLKWSTVEAILRNRPAARKISDQVLAQAQRDYLKLTPATAQRTLRFMQIRDTVK